MRTFPTGRSIGLNFFLIVWESLDYDHQYGGPPPGLLSAALFLDEVFANP